MFAGAIIGLVIVPGDQLIFRSLAGANLALVISWFMWMSICRRSGTPWLLWMWLLKLPLLGMRTEAAWGFTFTAVAFVIRGCQGDFAFPSWWATFGALLGLICSPLWLKVAMRRDSSIPSWPSIPSCLPGNSEQLWAKPWPWWVCHGPFGPGCWRVQWSVFASSVELVSSSFGVHHWPHEDQFPWTFDAEAHDENACFLAVALVGFGDEPPFSISHQFHKRYAQYLPKNCRKHYIILHLNTANTGMPTSVYPWHIKCSPEHFHVPVADPPNHPFLIHPFE